VDEISYNIFYQHSLMLLSYISCLDPTSITLLSHHQNVRGALASFPLRLKPYTNSPQ
jgi:hypothetical protein